MDAQRQLPQYQCHKKVWALKIKEVIVHALPNRSSPEEDAAFIESDAFMGATLIPVEAGYAPIPVDADWYRKHAPIAGGYWVQYEDGYTSYSPGPAFESGYTLLK